MTTAYRNSSFTALITVMLATALAGCRGTPIDVAKGRPTEPESSFVASDYKSKEPEGLERYSPENLGKTMRKAVGLGPNERIAQQHFDEGTKLFAAAAALHRDGKQNASEQFDDAAKKFKAAAARWPDSTLEENCMFLQAECCFFTDRYSKANDTYGELLKKYPNTRHLNLTVARQFSIAHYWHEVAQASPRWALVPNFTDRTQPAFDTHGHAINAFDNVRVNDPRGPLADSALMEVANIYFRQERYEDADYYYNLLRTDYPKSKLQLNAHLLGLQCKLRKYQGPSYNGKPLEEAEELIDRMLVQFPGEMGDERERIVKAKAEVRAQRATRDIQLAQYFDKGEHYGAARVYYARVLKEFPQTPFAEAAKTRLAALQDKPDHPPNRLAFLTDWLQPGAGDEATSESNAIALAQRQKVEQGPFTQTAVRAEEEIQSRERVGQREWPGQ